MADCTPLAPPVTRSMGATEQLWHAGRGTRGTLDSFTILCLKASIQVTFDDIVHAWAVIRISHPLLASSISLAGDVPIFLHFPAHTVGEALERARASIRLSTFRLGGRDEALAALCSRMADAKDDVLDIVRTTSRLSWFTPDPAAEGTSTEYIVAVSSVHSVCDAHGLFTAARQLLALLTEPDRAHRELTTYFASGASAEMPNLPVALDDLFPDPTETSIDEQCAGLDAHASLMAALKNPSSGIFPTGSTAEDMLEGRSMRHTFSSQDTAQLLKRCKAHNVTVTQFTSAALAVASLPPPGAASTLKEPVHFSIPHAADFRARAPANRPDEVAIRVTFIPTFARLPSIGAAHSPAAIWDIAHQCTESRDAFLGSQHLWHLVHHAATSRSDIFTGLSAGAPAVHAMFSAPLLPTVSSLGNCDALLPAVYRAEDGGREILMEDVVTAARAHPVIPVLHVWTFRGQFNLYLTHNGTHIAPAVMDAYFCRLVEVVIRFGIQEETTE